MTAPNAERAYRALDTARLADRLNMDHWCEAPDGAVSLAELTDENTCGTTACLAGWVVAMQGHQVQESGRVWASTGEYLGRVEQLAADWLGLSYAVADRLFYADNDQVDALMAEIFGPRPADTDGCPPGGCIPNFCVGADDCRREYDSNGDVIYDEDDLPPNAGSAS